MSDYREDALNLQEVRSRYVDAEASLRAVKEQLDGLSSARELEGEAASSLNGSAQAVRSLASDLATLTDRLHATVEAADRLLEASTGIINSSELAEIRSEVGELRAALRQDATETRTVIDAKVSQFHGKLESGVRSTNDRLDEMAKEIREGEKARTQLEQELASTRARLDEATRLLGRKVSKMSPPTAGSQQNLGFS